MRLTTRRVRAQRLGPFGVRAIIGALVAASLLAACAGFGDDTARLHQQAKAALARWADAVAAAGGPSPVVLVGERTGQVGDWEEAVGGNNKSALYAGLLEAPANLRSGAPPGAVVMWPDGTTAAVAVISADQALAAIRTDGTSSPCSDCTSLRVTAADLATLTIQTSRGAATGPVWEFSIEGTAVKVTRVAIADAITVVPPRWDANNAPVGLAIDSATGTVAGRELTVGFIGAPLPGDQPCGEDYTTESVESDLAIVVIVTRHPHSLIEACTAVGAARTATVKLASSLGSRAVLEVQQGLPVPVALTP